MDVRNTAETPRLSNHMSSVEKSIAPAISRKARTTIAPRMIGRDRGN